MLAVEPALHAHVDPREQREPGRVAAVLREAVGDHFLIAGVIGHDEALEPPFAAQKIGHQPAIAGRRNPGNLVERSHRGECAGVEPGPVRRQIDFAQSPFGHVDRVVVEPAFSAAISREMLDAGEHAFARPKVIALKALDSRSGEQLSEEHVLAAALDPAAPALVARDVDHRRKGPVDARSGRFESGRRGGSPRQVRFEAGDFGERDREDRAMAMDDVRGEDQRNLEPRFLDRRGLQDARHPRAIAVEDARSAGPAELPRPGAENWNSCCGGLSASAVPPPQAEAIRLSCPAFSSSVMRAMSSSTNAGTWSFAAAWTSARTGLATHAADNARAHQGSPPRNARVQHPIPLRRDGLQR